jgi:hypothetical protein
MPTCKLAIYKSDGTVNEAHPLLSTLRGRLPLADKDLPPIPAEDLRHLIEQPPFGWDSNAAKVGLAVLLRMSACRLVDNGKYITDPASPDAARLLSKDQPFRSLRVQGVQGDLDIATLKKVREHLEALFGTRSTLVAATLHNELGAALTALAARAKALADWAATAQCPLPMGFATGRDVAGEIAAISAPAQRLREFLDQTGALREYVTLLAALETFRSAHGVTFGTYRDFYNRMVNASLDLPELNAFIKNWRTVTGEATATVAARWQEIEASHALAEQALLRKAAAWREETERELAAAEAALPDDLREAGVPEDKIDEELQPLAAKFGAVRNRLQTTPNDAIAERGARLALQSARLEMQVDLGALREKYRPKVVDNVTQVSWRTLLGRDRIATAAELDAAIASLRSQVEPLIGAGRTVVVE